MELYLRSASDFKIEDENGNIYTLGQAREIIENKKLPIRCNIAFQRLVNYNFDIKKVKQFYKENK